MASSHRENDGIVQWPYAIESHFIRILHKDAKKGLKTPNSDKKTWIPVDNATFSKFSKKYIVPELSLKYDCLIKSYREFLKLLSHAGVGFNPTTKTINVAENAWDAYLKGNHLEVSDIDVESESDETTTPPAELPPIIDTPLNQCHQKEPQSFKNYELDAALETWTKTLTQNSDTESNHSLSFVSTATSCEKYSVTQCMAKLNSIVGLDNASYVRVCRKFVTYEWRVMFMMMSEENIRCLAAAVPTP